MEEIWQSIILAAQQMTVAEIVAVFFGIASVIYSKRESILVYPTGIISVVIFMYICFKGKIYAEMSINVFYFFMSIYGWYNWSSKHNKKNLEITKNTLKQNLFSILGVLVTWPIIYFILDKYTDSNVPFADSLATALFFVGMWLMAWKRIENWVALGIGNIISIPLFWYKEYYLVSLQFVVFTILAIWGYLAWRKKLKIN